MKLLAHRIAALAAALALAATMPFVCPCPPSTSASEARSGSHDCCAPADGVTAVDPGCCGGQSQARGDALAAADPSTAPPPAEAALPVPSRTAAPSRAVVRTVPAAVAPSPPPVLRI
jgi:hypothetical protein